MSADVIDGKVIWGYIWGYFKTEPDKNYYISIARIFNAIPFTRSIPLILQRPQKPGKVHPKRLSP